MRRFSPRKERLCVHIVYTHFVYRPKQIPFITGYPVFSCITLLASQEISFYFYLEIINHNILTNSISNIHKYFRCFYHMRTDIKYNILSPLGV